MKNILLTCILFVLPIYSFSQVKDSTRLSRFSIGIYYSPEVAYRQLAFSSEQKWVSDLRNEEEEAKYGFSSGLNVRVKLNKKFTLETGLSYSDKGERLKRSNLTWVNSNPNFPTATKTVFKFHYIEVPVKLNYFLSSKKLKYYVSAGLVAGRLLTKSTVVKVYSDQKTTRQASTQALGVNKFNFSFAVGVGINYQISQRISFNLEPMYSRSFRNIGANSNAKEYLYSVGLNTGFFILMK